MCRSGLPARRSLIVATLNDPEGLIVANAAIVPAGSPSGGVSVYNSGPSTTDVIIDMNGYFAPPSTGLQFFPVSPCRLVDTRGAAGGFQRDRSFFRTVHRRGRNADDSGAIDCRGRGRHRARPLRRDSFLRPGLLVQSHGGAAAEGARSTTYRCGPRARRGPSSRR